MSLKISAERSTRSDKVLRSLYPNGERKLLVQEVSYDSRKRQVKIVAPNKSAASRLFIDKDLIRAALRGEGLDVKEVLIS